MLILVAYKANSSSLCWMANEEKKWIEFWLFNAIESMENRKVVCIENVLRPIRKIHCSFINGWYNLQMTCEEKRASKLHDRTWSISTVFFSLLDFFYAPITSKSLNWLLNREREKNMKVACSHETFHTFWANIYVLSTHTFYIWRFKYCKLCGEHKTVLITIGWIKIKLVEPSCSIEERNKSAENTNKFEMRSFSSYFEMNSIK